LNKYSIGIELMAIGTEAEMAPMMSVEHYKKIPKEHIGYTEAQYGALNLLLDDILTRNKKIKRDREHIIGHDEYAPERKTDPGSLFEWVKVLPVTTRNLTNGN
jgi:N-acetyl-anhydromuramyl-L-alanine amidase AmpD